MQPASCRLFLSVLCYDSPMGQLRSRTASGAGGHNIYLDKKEISVMKKKKDNNYLDYIPVKNPEIEYETDENDRVTVYIEWKGFYHRIAQKFFHRPRVSDVKLDDYGSFVWLAIDDMKDVHQLSKELDSRFPKMEKSLSRLIKFLEILHDNRLIHWKGENVK